MEDIIDAYKNVPYFNNKFRGRRAGLKVEIGKGSPKEIMDEVESLLLKEKIDIKNLSDFDIRKFMVLHDIGIECSGFAYRLLDEESKRRGYEALEKKLKFPYSSGIIGRFRSIFRPIENADVKTFAHDKNSKVIEIKDVRAGDMITMIGDRDHILIVKNTEFENLIIKNIYYVHAIAWPTDGEYGHGIHEGKIEVIDLNKKLVDQRWIELGVEGNENYTYKRARESVTELRRLNWFS